MKARQCIPRLDLPRGDELRDLQHPHSPRLLGGIHEANRRIRRAEVDADDVAAGQVFRQQVGGHGLVVATSRRGVAPRPLVAALDQESASFRTLNSSFQRFGDLVLWHQSSKTPSSVSCEWKRTGTKSSSIESSRGSSASSESVSESSSSVQLGKRSPGLSCLRTAELKKRNVAGSPTTRPNSPEGTSIWVPSSMPKGTTQRARSGRGAPGMARPLVSMPT